MQILYGQMYRSRNNLCIKIGGIFFSDIFMLLATHPEYNLELDGGITEYPVKSVIDRNGFQFLSKVLNLQIMLKYIKSAVQFRILVILKVISK